MTDKLREECGVVGVLGESEASNIIYLALYALQHRGQEAAGIVTYDAMTSQPHVYKEFGLVGEIFTRARLSDLKGDAGLGHNRYSTHGGRHLSNVQPYSFHTPLGHIAIAHNGNLTNADQLRGELERRGSVFHASSDSEIFVHLLACSPGDTVRERIVEVMKRVRGAYALVFLTEDRLFAVRDPHGFRPLVLGARQGGHIVVSESCALDLVDATYVRTVEPGEIVELSRDGNVQSFFPLGRQRQTFCSFEPIYFSRPDSEVFGTTVYELRRHIGAELAREAPAEGDIVVAVPDSGVPMAMGYAQAIGIPLELGFVRNHYVGRTFIEPVQAIRDFGVKLKLNPVTSAVAGKRVIVVDDSIVRGTTAAKIMRMLRRAGALEIHLRIGSPPITHSCFYGVDTPNRNALIAAQKPVDLMREYLGAETLAFLSEEGLRRALADAPKGKSSTAGDGAAEGTRKYCYACFTGAYPEDICRTIETQPTDKNGPGRAAFAPGFEKTAQAGIVNPVAKGKQV